MAAIIRVLYVDDESTLLEIGKLFLENQRQFIVDTCTSATEALERLNPIQYDVIVSDYQMPEMDGIAFLKIIRLRYPTLPFIIFTGGGREDIAITAFENGADFFLQKGGAPKPQFIELSRKIIAAVEWRRAETAFKRSEEQYRNLFETMMQGVIYHDNTGKITKVNPAAERILGLSFDQMNGRTNRELPWTVIHEDGTAFPGDTHPVMVSLATGKNTRDVLGVNNPVDHTCHWIIVDAIPQFKPGETVPYQIYSTFEDITDRKNTEQALWKTREKLRIDETILTQISSGSPFGLYIVNSRTDEIVYFNDRFVTIWGLESIRESLVKGLLKNSDLLSYFAPLIVDLPAFIESCKTLENEENRVEVETEILFADGRTIRCFSSQIRDADDRFYGRYSLFEDITEHTRTKKDLQEREERFRDLITTTADIIWQTDEQSRFVYISPQVEGILGYRPDELIGKKPFDFLEPVSVESNREAFRAVLMSSQKLVSNDSYWIHKNGHRVILENRAMPIFSTDGSIVGFHGIDRDITERKQMEEALQQANKKLNQFTSVTRHDILNQLTIIKGFLQQSYRFINDPAQLESFIQIEERAASMIEHQIAFTRHYQKMGVKDPAWQNVRDNIERAITALPMQDIKVIIAGLEIEVFADHLFEKVFYNLIDNALKYGNTQMTTIKVTSRESNNGNGFVIACEDDGEGITEENKPQLFQKGCGKNTGLGLFLAQEILAITGMTIRETGTPGKGARFEITVPKGLWRSTKRNA
ncbi:MAG: PAS domain S-box protein [Methanoregula sp.]|nr:PAS domain S-box protein [Methanoregula sp.]